MITMIINNVATVILFIMVSILFVVAFIQGVYIYMKRTLFSRVCTGCFREILQYIE